MTKNDIFTAIVVFLPDFVCNELQDLRKDHAILRGDLRALINMHSETNVLLRELITKVSPSPAVLPNNQLLYSSPPLVDPQQHLDRRIFTSIHVPPHQMPSTAASAVYTPRPVEPQLSQIQRHRLQPAVQQQHTQIPYPILVNQIQQTPQLQQQQHLEQQQQQQNQTLSKSEPKSSRTAKAQPISKRRKSAVIIDDLDEDPSENLLTPQINTVSSTVEELSIMDINLSDDDFFSQVVSIES